VPTRPLARIPAPQASRSRPLLSSLGEVDAGGGAVITLRDLLAVLERDPAYCRSALLYRLANAPPPAAAP
jgi:hypothetical protein